MKINSILFAGCAVVLAALSSCADDDFVTTIANLEDYAPQKDYSKFNLGSYNPLKTYVNYSANPDFKLGIAVTASQYAEKTGVFLLANDNFDEVVAGNAMKMDQCVSADGAMDFSKVETFVDAAYDAERTVYGHTLAWHSQQPKKWLESLIADKVMSLEQMDEDIFEYTFDDGASFGGWGNGSTIAIGDGGVDGSKCLNITNPSAVNFWEAQAAIDMAYEADRDYELQLSVRATGEGTLRAGFQNSSNYAGCGDFPPVSFSTEWKTVKVTATATEGVNRFLFSYGDFAGTIYLDDVKLIKKAKGGNKSATIFTQPVEVQMASLFNDDFSLNKSGSLNLHAIAVHSTDKIKETWDNQFFMKATKPFKAGDVTKVKFSYRATKKAKASTQIHSMPGTYLHWMAIGDVNFTEEWQDFEANFTIPNEAGEAGQTIAFNLSELAQANDYYFDNISWTTVSGEELINNGNCEGDDVSCFFATVGQKGPSEAKIEEIAFPSIVVRASDKVKDAWDNQFFIVANQELQAGTVTKISFKYKATAAAKASTQCHTTPGNYIHWLAIGDVNFTKEWQDFSLDFTIPEECRDKGMKTIAFNLNEYAKANDYYFRDIVWTLSTGESLINNGDLTGDDFSSFVSRYYGKGDVNPDPEEISVFEKIDENAVVIKLTPEEKKEILADAMSKWIEGMMKACDGRVKAWDVVNEAISGADTDGDGKYDLQHAENASDNDKKSCFYWQDYLGDVDYVRIAVSRARQYFAATGGNPSELKLFVNDYNLESNWDDNAKLKSLIKWCGEWENDTVKIDGLGTQMHVSYDAREGALDSQKKHIKQMFELMAATGKLVRVSELDMGYIDSKGNSVKTVDITVEQEAQMAEFYKYIVKTYFEVVPAAQRYGITHWSMTDSPEGSGWRGGDPIGLWTGTYERKPAYAGYAEGLQEGSGAAK